MYPESTRQVMRLCTSAAEELLSEQWALRTNYKVRNELAGGRFLLNSGGANCTRTVRIQEGRLFCDCPFAVQLLLPCRHLLAIKGGLDLQDVHHRWLVSYWLGQIDAPRCREYIGATMPAHLLEAPASSARGDDADDLDMDTSPSHSEFVETQSTNTFNLMHSTTETNTYCELRRTFDHLFNKADSRGKDGLYLLVQMMKKTDKQLDNFDVEPPHPNAKRHKYCFERT